MHSHHIPIRTCVACRTSGDKRGLLRLVRTPEGSVVYDPTGKANGRGAYVCASDACIAAVRKRRHLVRSLKAEATEEVYDLLNAEAARRTTPFL